MKPAQKNGLIYILFISAQTLFYEATGFVNSSPWKLHQFYQPSTYIDELIPLIPETIWLYCLYYVILILGVVLARDEDIFPEFLKSLFAVSMVADLLFILVPVNISTPVLGPEQQQTLSGSVFSFVVSLDTNGNCFPSLHCAHSLFITYWAGQSRKLRPYVAPLFGLITILVIISTLTLKKHWLVDVLGAFVFLLYLLNVERKRTSEPFIWV